MAIEERMASASPTLLNAGMGDYAKAEWHDYFADFIHLIPEGSRVLDVGSGAGGLAVWLTERRNCDVVCIDASPDAIDRCRAKGLVAHSVDLNADARIEGTYDVVLFSSSLESLLDPCRVLRNVRSNVRPDGRILIWMPNSTFAGARLALLRGKAIKCIGNSSAARALGIWGYDDIQFFSKNSLELALREAGYESPEWHLKSSPIKVRGWRSLRRACAFFVVGLICGFRQPGLYSPSLCVTAKRGELR